MQSLNVSNGEWEELPPLSEERWGAALCVVGGRLFVIGGMTPSGDPWTCGTSVVEYLEVEPQWVSVPDMPRAIISPSVVALNGKLLVIGGYQKPDGNRSGPTCAVLEYNPADRSWKELPRLLTARYRCAVTVLGGDVVAIGGTEAYCHYPV